MKVQNAWASIASILILLTLMAGAVTYAGGAAALAQPSNGLFIETKQQGALGPDYPPSVIRGRYVIVDFARLSNLRDTAAERLELNLFPGTTLIAARYDVQTGSYGYEVWLGRIEGEPDSQVTLVVGHGIATANVSAQSTSYQVRYAGAGLHSVYEVDAGITPPYTQPIEVPGLPPAPDLPPTEPGTDPVEIDVMVVWTSAARNAAGGRDPLLSRINLAVAETNTAYTNSLVNAHINLVHADEVVYTESGTSSTDLGRLRATNDGYMDEVHPWRDQHSADMVSLIFNNNTVCGQAYLMTVPSPNFASSAFSVVYWPCATGNYSFGHELGHNQGSHHDRANTGGGQGSYPYSFGYQAPTCNPRFRTIMAYDCTGGGCTRRQYFSNPDVMVNGCPSGVPITEPNSAHNALSLNNTAQVVANWRLSPGCTPGPDYLVRSANGASIVPGTTQVPGSNCTSCVVNVQLPFAYELYGISFLNINVSNKGNLQFSSANSTGNNTCLSTPLLSHAIMPYWDDLVTNIDDQMGIYTSTSGIAPNRIFNIEWRAGYIANDARANFEARLYEGQPKFEFIYGQVHQQGYGATIGVQEWTNSRFTQHSCDTQSIQQGTQLTFDRRKNCP